MPTTTNRSFTPFLVVIALSVATACSHHASSEPPRVVSHADPEPARTSSPVATDWARLAQLLIAESAVAYSTVRKVVIYVECSHGGGEHRCQLVAKDEQGRPSTIPAMQWSDGSTESLHTRVRDLLVEHQAIAMPKTPWVGGLARLDIPGFGSVEWDRSSRDVIATASGGRRSRVRIDQAMEPYAMMTADSVPVAAIGVTSATGNTNEGLVNIWDLEILSRP